MLISPLFESPLSYATRSPRVKECDTGEVTRLILPPLHVTKTIYQQRECNRYIGRSKKVKWERNCCLHFSGFFDLI